MLPQFIKKKTFGQISGSIADVGFLEQVLAIVDLCVANVKKKHNKYRSKLLRKKAHIHTNNLLSEHQRAKCIY